MEQLPEGVTLPQIISKMKSPTAADIALVTKAHDFAKEAHKNQVRFSGAPYFTHLIGTAYNLAELGMGAKTIAAGFLHDSIEDAATSPEVIQKEFGDEILFLIEGVTKLGKIRYQGAERHNESLRKLFIATSQDIRVLIIKLADRLHNIGTLEFVRPEKQKRIATETLQIYAPIAYRLGIRKLNRALEDLSFPYVYPEEFKKVNELLKEKEKESEESLIKFHKLLKKELALKGYTKFSTDFRIKGLYSLYQKLEKKDNDIEKIYDINAIRVLVPTISDCYNVLGIVHGTWRPLPGRIKDYIAFPKPNGYKSIHTTIFTGDGKIVEIQIKTFEMHEEAEYGIASHINYKDKAEKTGYLTSWVNYLMPKETNWGNSKTNGVDTDFSIPKWIKDLVAYQKEKKTNDGYEEDLREDFFKERIFVFTPRGDVVDLPIDSTPVDFAYTIHSDIGNKMISAKVNGKNSAFDAKLSNGDIVEIKTTPKEKPNRKWLEFVKTTIAQRHIRSFYELPPRPLQQMEKKKLKSSKVKQKD